MAIGLGVTFRALLDVARNLRLVTRAALANYISVPATALGLLLRRQLCRAHGPREGNREQSAKIQRTPSQLGFSCRASSVGCRLCVTRLASLEPPRIVKDEATSLQGPSRFSLRLRKGALPLPPEALEWAYHNQTPNYQIT